MLRWPSCLASPHTGSAGTRPPMMTRRRRSIIVGFGHIHSGPQTGKMGSSTLALAAAAIALLLLGPQATVVAVQSITNSSPWAPVSIVQDGPGPQPSMSHAAGALRNGTSLVVFGGCTSSCCFAPVDALWELRLTGLNAGNWRQLTTNNDDQQKRPGPRFSAATAVDPAADAMIMYGGQDSSQAFLSELWRLELRGEEGQAQWTHIRTPLRHTPPPRGAASLSLLGGRFLLLYGGFGRDGARNDAWALDLAKQQQGWWRIAVKGAADVTSPPPHRWHHTAVAVGERTVVIVGGSDGAGTDAGDAWTLEVDLGAGTAVWAPLVPADEATGGIPARHGHMALRPETGKSEGAGLASFVVFGGANTTANTLPGSFLGDAYQLDVVRGKWAAVEKGEGEVAPGKRAYAAVANGRSQSIVFGGFAGYNGDVDDRLLDDVWVFRHEGVGLEDGVGGMVANE